MDVIRSGRPTSPRLCVMVLILSVHLITCGCSTSASLQFTDLNYKRLDPGTPLSVEVTPTSSTWSIDEDKIQIALADGAVEADAGDRMAMSIILDGTPTGNELEYRVGQRALRCYWHHNRQHERFASLGGVVSVRLLPNENLFGRFKILARKQVFHILTNWTTVGQTLLTGTFTAHRDADKVSSILVLTEKGGMERTVNQNTIGSGVPLPREVVGPTVN